MSFGLEGAFLRVDVETLVRLRFDIDRDALPVPHRHHVGRADVHVVVDGRSYNFHDQFLFLLPVEELLELLLHFLCLLPCFRRLDLALGLFPQIPFSLLSSENCQLAGGLDVLHRFQEAEAD